MLARFRAHVRHNVVGYAALFVALGPAAYATHHAVNSANIINGQVKNQDLATDSVGTGKIINGNVRAGDLGQITTRTSEPVSVPGGEAHNGQPFTRWATADCEAGEKAISGGAYWASFDNSALTIQQSFAVDSNGNPAQNNPKSWAVRAGNDSGVARTVWAQVLCLKG